MECDRLGEADMERRYGAMASPPRIDFNTLHGGVILKNEWLPKRLR